MSVPRQTPKSATAAGATTAPAAGGRPLRVVGEGGGPPDGPAKYGRPVPVPGFPDVLLDLDGDCLIRLRGEDESLFLDWAPHLEAWWTDSDGVPVYRVRVAEQVEDVIPETLRDGTAWDLFEYATGHAVRTVREALAGCVQVQRRAIPKAPGLSALGWHDIEGTPVYVTSGTSFGPAGPVVANVHAYDADEAALPAAPEGDRLRDVVALSLSALDAAVLRVSAPSMCSVWLAPLISLFGNDLPRFVPWMWSDGRAQVFGVLKSSFAAILQAHSGTGYRGESDMLPAADTTLPALSAVLGVRRDGLVVVDDYKPGETSSVEAKTQTMAEQGIRMATNRQRRAKARAKGPGLAKVMSCMALMMMTAESLPLFDSGSTHDRTFPFQVHKGDVDPARLTVLQDRVEDLPEAGAGYAAWLAAHHGQVTRYLVTRFRELRAELRSGEQVTGRACAHIAHMMCAAEVFTRFAVDVDAMDADRRPALLCDIRAALIEAATAAVAERTEDQPHEVWLRTLRTLFAGGKLYAITPTGGPQSGPNDLRQPRAYAEALGWGPWVDRRGTLAGYALPDGLAVLETSVTPEIVRQSKGLAVTGVQLRRLLAARGIITPVEHNDGKHHHQKRIRTEVGSAWCPVIPWDVLLSPEGGDGPTDGAPGSDGPALCGGCGGPFLGGVPDPSGYHPTCDPGPDSDPSGWGPGTIGAAAWSEGEQAWQDALPDPAPAPTSTPAAVPAAVPVVAPARPVVATVVAPVVAPVVDAKPAPAAAVPSRPSTSTRKPAAAPVVVPDGPHAGFLAAAVARKSIRTDAQREALAGRLTLLDDPEIGETPEKLRILAALEGPRGSNGPFAPQRGRRGPWWQPDMPGMLESVQVMNGWDWEREGYTGPAVVLDRNGSWPTAVSSVSVAHGGLDHTGPLEDITGKPRPGYYRVTVYPWHETGMPSPLGNETPGTEVWVTATRMHLLLDLAGAGRWPDGSALDSYTGDPARLSDWAHLVGELRRYALEVHGRESGAYDAVKEAFGQSMGLLHGSWEDEGAMRRRKWSCKARRIDWAHGIKDQASATLWRTADAVRQLAPDLGPLSLRNVDELVIPAAALEVVTADTDGRRPAVRIDALGTTFGTWKVKDTESWGE